MRFYDPQITYAYLSLLNAGDQASLLNGISRLWRAIGEDGLLEQLDMGQDSIQRQRIDLNEALATESTGESDATV